MARIKKMEVQREKTWYVLANLEDIGKALVEQRMHHKARSSSFVALFCF